ncbi:SIMPL domain-containing protein [Nocardioides anomalus]|uniref:SIMPL domain-containing protein n=1 Tax=Nocardioides anomalus TaxID=2712223 RepID=A0A6G6WBH8_9ACTN|nr:SIMPL domain-containing protein [Nocardioides anomalus]QIG42569.1 SIMPL domain-containing protein [Nocardioides anomalus]
MRTLTVTGHGQATAVPDTAVVRVSATHRADSLADALAGAESARASIAAAADDLVVSTVNLSVWPVRDSGRAPAQFEARHTLTIATDSVADANHLLQLLSDDVGDRLVVEGVDLTVQDPTAAIGEAREAAFADARAKAEHLAALAGATLGQVESLSEGGAVSGPPLTRTLAAKADVGLQPGETALAAVLTVTFALV